MALLIPLLPLVLGVLILGYAWWRKSEFKGAYFAGALYLAIFCVALPFLALDGYRRAVTGQWAAATISDALRLLGKAGVDVAALFEPAPLGGLQPLNELYLQTNVGWTFLFVPLALLGVWGMMARQDPAKTKEGRK